MDHQYLPTHVVVRSTVRVLVGAQFGVFFFPLLEAIFSDSLCQESEHVIMVLKFQFVLTIVCHTAR